jgi:hypothetical protein
MAKGIEQLQLARVPKQQDRNEYDDEVLQPSWSARKNRANLEIREWFRLLGQDGVKVWAISPGYLATGLGVGQEQNKTQGAIDPSIGAAIVKDVLEGVRDEEVGKVVSKQGVQPW